jgi:hypothetical protein
MYKKERSTAVIGKKKRTWLRRPKHSLSLSFPFFFLSDLPLGSFAGLLILVQGRAEGHVAKWYGHRAALGL